MSVLLDGVNVQEMNPVQMILSDFSDGENEMMRVFLMRRKRGD